MNKNKWRCPGCMKELTPDSKLCPHCGFSTEEYEKEKDTRVLPAGTILKERYWIGVILGSGGFGITYLAWDLKEQIKVAIKEYFPREMARRNTEKNGQIKVQEEDKGAFDRGLKDFSREGKNLTKFCKMDGIVLTRNFFYENGTAYLVMEYLSGINLKEYMEQTGRIFQEQELLEKMKPLLYSLGQIHKNGMIHRDISPDNIIIDEKGGFTLIDFGAARIMEEEQNRSTTLLMKYGYAPEEQYRSRGKLGPWSDIYALSATMYYLLTGVRPVQSIDRLAEDDMLPLSRMGIHISERTSLVIKKGMEVLSENRYQCLEDLCGDLYEKGKIKIPFPEKTAPERHPFKKHSRTVERWILFLALILVAIVGSFLFLIGTRRIDPRIILNQKKESVALSSTKETMIKKKEGKIFALLRDNTTSYSRTEADFIEAEAKKRGFTEVIFRYYGEDEVSQNHYVKEAVSSGCDAIICDPGYRTFYTALFRQAVEAGIPVIIVNHGTDDYENITMTVGADTDGGMKMAAEKLRDILGGEGVYAELLGNENIDSVTGARAAIDEVMDKTNMELFATETVERNNQSAEEGMRRLLEECKDLNGVLCNSNAIGTGAAKAIKKAGLSGKVHIVTIGGSDRLKEMTKEGLIDAVVVRPLDDMLSLALNEAARLTNHPGQSVAPVQTVPCILLDQKEIDKMNSYSVDHRN